MNDAKRVLEGLRYCIAHEFCDGVPTNCECPIKERCLTGDSDVLMIAADLIEMLAAENVRNEIQIDMLRHDKEELNGIIDNLKARCEAAVRDLSQAKSCAVCVYASRDLCDPNAEEGSKAYDRFRKCRLYGNKIKWEWRGPRDGGNEDEEP